MDGISPKARRRALVVSYCLMPFLASLQLFSLIARGEPQAGALTLGGALAQAVDGSPQLQKAKSVAKESDAHELGSYSFFLPTLSASANYLLAKKYLLTDVTLPGAPAAVSIPGIIPTTVASLDAKWTLFDGLGSLDTLRAASELKNAAHHDSDWARFQVQRQVVLGFYKALGAQTLKEVAEQNLKTIEDHQRDVNLFQKAGLSTKFDVLRVDVQVSEARSELLNAQDSMENAKGRLAEVLGAESEERDLMGVLPEPNADWAKNMAANELAQRKDLVALSERVQSVNYMKSAAASHWLPRIGLSGSYQYYNNLNDDAFDRNAFRTAYQLGIGLSWNLFGGFANIARQREATEKGVQAEATLKATQLHAKQDFDYWHKRFLYYCSIFHARQSDITKSSESVRLAKEGRRAGTLTNTELLDSELELFRARAGLVNSQIGAVEALINLELATGRDLHSFE